MRMNRAVRVPGYIVVGSVVLSCGMAVAQGKIIGQPANPATTAPVPAKTPAAAAAMSATEYAPGPDRGPAYYHYTLAKMYEQLASQGGQQDAAAQALEQYKLALNLDPDNRTLQDGLPSLYFRLGRIREAIDAADAQVKAHPDDIAAHELLGRVYLRTLGNGQSTQSTQSAQVLQLAIKEYQTIEQLKPKDAETHLLLGQLYGLDHEISKAEAEYKAAGQDDPNNDDVALNLARLYTEQGNLAKAAAVLEEIPQDDRSARIDFALANFYDQLHQPKKAAAAYKLALAQDPENTDAQRGYAAALMTQGDLAQAEKAYQRLVAADSQDAQSLVRLAEIERQQGEYDAALAHLKTAKSIISGDPELDYNEALTDDALGHFDDAIAALNQALADLMPSSTGKGLDGQEQNRALFLDRMGILYREEGKTGDAVAAYKRMQALGPDFKSRGAEGIVDAYRDAHDWKASLAAARQAAEAMPNDKDIQLTYARELGDSGELEAGLKLATQQLKNTPEDKDVYYTIADMNVRARHYKEAYAALDKVEPLTKTKDEKVFLLYYRGTVADRQKQYDLAESEFRKGLALDPGNAMIGNDLGYMMAERGVNLPEAVTMLQKAVAYDPQNGAYLDSLGWAYYREGQYAMAVQTMQKAVLRQGNDPTVREHLGAAYEKDGKLQQAIAEWEKATAQYQTSLRADTDPTDEAKLNHELDAARVKQAHLSPPPTH
jgi:tetratricopeptide (TPR) repeat protein